MNINSDCLSKLHPTVAALVYLTATGRISNDDRLLASQLAQSPEWETLSPDEAQWVSMLNGTGIAPEGEERQAAIDILTTFLPLLEDCHVRQRVHL